MRAMIAYSLSVSNSAARKIYCRLRHEMIFYSIGCHQNDAAFRPAKPANARRAARLCYHAALYPPCSMTAFFRSPHFIALIAVMTGLTALSIDAVLPALKNGQFAGRQILRCKAEIAVSSGDESGE